jgi:hypothetical protein
MRRSAGYSARPHEKHILDKMKVTPITEYVKQVQTELVTTCKKNGQSQDSKTNVSICSH